MNSAEVFTVRGLNVPISEGRLPRKVGGGGVGVGERDRKGGSQLAALLTIWHFPAVAILPSAIVQYVAINMMNARSMKRNTRTKVMFVRVEAMRKKKVTSAMTMKKNASQNRPLV